MGTNPVPDTIEVIQFKDKVVAYAFTLAHDFYERIEKEDNRSQRRG